MIPDWFWKLIKDLFSLWGATITLVMDILVFLVWWGFNKVYTAGTGKSLVQEFRYKWRKWRSKYLVTYELTSRTSIPIHLLYEPGKNKDSYLKQILKRIHETLSYLREKSKVVSYNVLEVTFNNKIIQFVIDGNEITSDSEDFFEDEPGKELSSLGITIKWHGTLKEIEKQASFIMKIIPYFEKAVTDLNGTVKAPHSPFTTILKWNIKKIPDLYNLGYVLEDVVLTGKIKHAEDPLNIKLFPEYVQIYDSPRLDKALPEIINRVALLYM